MSGDGIVGTHCALAAFSCTTMAVWYAGRACKRSQYLATAGVNRGHGFPAGLRHEACPQRMRRELALDTLRCAALLHDVAHGRGRE